MSKTIDIKFNNKKRTWTISFPRITWNTAISNIFKNVINKNEGLYDLDKVKMSCDKNGAISFIARMTDKYDIDSSTIRVAKLIDIDDIIHIFDKGRIPDTNSIEDTEETSPNVIPDDLAVDNMQNDLIINNILVTKMSYAELLDKKLPKVFKLDTDIEELKNLVFVFTNMDGRSNEIHTGKTLYQIISEYDEYTQYRFKNVWDKTKIKIKVICDEYLENV